MNTINVLDTDTDVSVMYTEAEVRRLVQDNKQLREYRNETKYKVRDFFSEAEWDDGYSTFSRDDVNKLLSSIGAANLSIEYRATVTITATITSYEADDEETARDYIQGSIDIGIDNGDIEVESITIEEIELEEGY